MPAPLLTKDEVIARLLIVFRERGYEGASLTEISHATGLGRSSLYHYFPGGKADMASAVLGLVKTWMQTHALDPLRGPGTPPQRLAAMSAALEVYYGGGRSACLLAALAHGAGRELFQTVLTAAFSGWVGALSELAIEAGVPPSEAGERAEDVVIRIEGSLVVAAGINDPAPFIRALRNIERDFFRPSSAARRGTA